MTWPLSTIAFLYVSGAAVMFVVAVDGGKEGLSMWRTFVGVVFWPFVFWALAIFNLIRTIRGRHAL